MGEEMDAERGYRKIIFIYRPEKSRSKGSETLLADAADGVVVEGNEICVFDSVGVVAAKFATTPTEDSLLEWWEMGKSRMK